MDTVRHHLVDIVNPDYNFTAGDFCLRASQAINEITERGKVPLLAGGTGFYINSLVYGIDEIPDIPPSVKEKVASEYDNGGQDLLYQELKRIDPVFADKVHKNDRQRIIRGLSVYRDTGKSISSYFGDNSRNSSFDYLFIGLYIEKGELHKRIDLRTETMIKNGFIAEVEKLRSMGYSPELNSMKSIGYSEVNRYLDGVINFQCAIDEIKKNTKQYAKKQMTWFKKNKSVTWFGPDQIEKIPDKIKSWLY